MKVLMKPELTSEFIEELSSQIGEAGSTHEVILELLNRGIIKEKTVRNYLIIKKYPKALRENHNQSNAATSFLSYKYGISERTVYHILKEKRNDY